MICFCLAIIIWVFSLTHRGIYKNGLHLGRSSHMGDDFLHYFVLPNELNLNSPKIIFLWTTYFGDYQHWSSGIGPQPEISDCNDAEETNPTCLITTHGDLLEQADVVLFALQDIQQVTEKLYLETLNSFKLGICLT